MAAIDAKAIQEMLDQIDALKKNIVTAGDVGRTKLNDIKVDDVRQAIPRTQDGKLDAAEWAKRGEDEQNKAYGRLVLVRDSLHAAAGLDGPIDPQHIMYAEYASNTAIVVWALISFLLTASLLGAIGLLWSKATNEEFARKSQVALVALRELDEARDKAKQANATEIESRRAAVGEAEGKANLSAIEAIQALRKGSATESSVLAMIILLGALGGSLHFVGSLVKYVGNRQLKRSWLLFYMSTPLVGAALAPIVYMLLRVGILAPSGVTAEGSSIANLNLTGIYAFAALTGLFSKTALEKLSEVFGTLFRVAETSKDRLGSERQSGGAATPTGKQP